MRTFKYDAAPSPMEILTHPMNPVPNPIDLNITSFSELKTLYHKLVVMMGMAVILRIYTLKQLFEPVKPLAVDSWTFIVWQLSLILC